jgi:hypothetical protein
MRLPSSWPIDARSGRIPQAASCVYGRAASRDAGGLPVSLKDVKQCPLGLRRWRSARGQLSCVRLWPSR